MLVSLFDTYRKNIERKTDELSRLLSQKALESGRLPALSNKINLASQAYSRATSLSHRNYKLREIERYQREYAAIEKKMADFDKNISKKQKEINDEQKKALREEQVMQKKQAYEQLKRTREYERDMRDFSLSLDRHEHLHNLAISKIDALQKLPDTITVLFLASNPVDQEHIRLDEEVRSIQEMIRKSKHRDVVRLETRWAVRPLDILQSINELGPTIIHFSGHGSDNSEIVFQREDGSTHAVSEAAIVETIAASSSKIRLVFFNTCYSRQQAIATIKHVEAAIGMKTSIGDYSARIFSAQFYSSIGFGLSVKNAFAQAKSAIMMEGTQEEDTPELFVKEALNAEEIFLVAPE